MNYNSLILNIFGELKECITEDEFVNKLPVILGNNKLGWSGDDLSKLICLAYGLDNNKRHTYKEIAKIFNSSPTTIGIKLNRTLVILRRPEQIVQYLLELSDYQYWFELSDAEKSWGNAYSSTATRWYDAFSEDIQQALLSLNVMDEYDCYPLTIGTIRLLNNKIIDPRIRNLSRLKNNGLDEIQKRCIDIPLFKEICKQYYSYRGNDSNMDHLNINTDLIYILSLMQESGQFFILVPGSFLNKIKKPPHFIYPNCPYSMYVNFLKNTREELETAYHQDRQEKLMNAVSSLEELGCTVFHKTEAQ
jgi:hypothetical protein